MQFSRYLPTPFAGGQKQFKLLKYILFEKNLKIHKINNEKSLWVHHSEM
jgi:hypothetical protein